MVKTNKQNLTLHNPIVIWFYQCHFSIYASIRMALSSIHFQEFISLKMFTIYFLASQWHASMWLVIQCHRVTKLYLGYSLPALKLNYETNAFQIFWRQITSKLTVAAVHGFYEVNIKDHVWSIVSLCFWNCSFSSAHQKGEVMRLCAFFSHVYNTLPQGSWKRSALAQILNKSGEKK